MGSAEVIVTENLKDFPTAKLPALIRAVPAREFAYDTVRQHLTQGSLAVIALCERSGRQGPKLSVSDLLTILDERYKMTATAELLSMAPGLRDILH